MKKDTTISLRINSDLKNDVDKILKSLGIPMTTAITMYFNQIKMRKGIPFTPVISNMPKAYEEYTDDWLIEFEKCDDYETGNKLFGKPNDWNYADEPKQLLLQFDPLDSEMGLFSHLDGLIYFFLGDDKKTFKDVEILEEIS